jgi:glycosyltransferase involved in cell wall biosynthesis
MAAANTRILVGLISHNRFTFTKEAVAHILKTQTPFDFLIVDAGSEAQVKSAVFELSQQAGARLFSLENRNCNGARDVINHYGLYYDYVIYIDNDALPPAGWLDALLEAGESGAALIGAPQAALGGAEPRFVGSFDFPRKEMILFKEWEAPLDATQKVDWVTGNCLAVRGDFLRRIWMEFKLWERWRKFPIDLDDIDLAMMARKLGEPVVAAPLIVPQNRAFARSQEAADYRLERDDFHNYALSCVWFWKEWHYNPLLNWNSGYTAINYKPGRIYDQRLAQEFRCLVDMLRDYSPAVHDVLTAKLAAS